jgi:hypothetical protein
VRVKFDHGYRAMVQTKRTVERGPRFDSVVKQWRSAAERGLDPRRDRLVVVAKSFEGRLSNLPSLLDRLRTDDPGGPNADEALVIADIDRGLAGLDDDRRQLVYHCAAAHVLDVEEQDGRDAKLVTSLLANVFGPRQASVVWVRLVALAGATARIRGGYEVIGWLEQLGKDFEVVGANTPAAEMAIALRDPKGRFAAWWNGAGRTTTMRVLTVVAGVMSLFPSEAPVFVPPPPLLLVDDVTKFDHGQGKIEIRWKPEPGVSYTVYTTVMSAAPAVDPVNGSRGMAIVYVQAYAAYCFTVVGKAQDPHHPGTLLTYRSEPIAHGGVHCPDEPLRGDSASSDG